MLIEKKYFIAALIARQFRSSWKIIICPPVLKDYWEETFHDFGLSRFKVFSGGNLPAIKEWDRIDDIEYVFVDEAHRFRNEDTETFKDLHDICFGNTKTKEDYILWLKLSRMGIEINLIDKKLSCWRKNKNSLSSSAIQKLFDGFKVYYKYMKFNFFMSLYLLLRLSIYSLLR